MFNTYDNVQFFLMKYHRTPMSLPQNGPAEVQCVDISLQTYNTLSMSQSAEDLHSMRSRYLLSNLTKYIPDKLVWGGG